MYLSPICTSCCRGHNEGSDMNFLPKYLIIRQKRCIYAKLLFNGEKNPSMERQQIGAYWNSEKGGVIPVWGRAEEEIIRKTFPKPFLLELNH